MMWLHRRIYACNNIIVQIFYILKHIAALLKWNTYSSEFYTIFCCYNFVHRTLTCTFCMAFIRRKEKKKCIKKFVEKMVDVKRRDDESPTTCIHFQIIWCIQTRKKRVKGHQPKIWKWFNIIKYNWADNEIILHSLHRILCVCII